MSKGLLLKFSLLLWGGRLVPLVNRSNYVKWLRSHMVRASLALMLLAFALFTVDRLCYEVSLPVEIDIQGGVTSVHVGSQTVPLGTVGTPAMLQFAAHDPVVHEYQLDGTDSTNNFTLDSTYLNQIASSPYYRFQAWMRDLDGTSQWRNLQVWADGRLLGEADSPPDGASISLASHASLRILLQLQRPETPMTLNLIEPDGATLSILLDRNDRQIAVTRLAPGTTTPTPLAKTFFPLDPAPFAAMVIDFLVRTLLWTLLVLAVVLVGEVGVVLIRGVGRHLAQPVMPMPTGSAQTKENDPGSDAHKLRRYLGNALHPIALIALGGSLLFVSWIAYVQYHAEPHIYDASAYLFTAKMFAIGQLSVPIPPAIDRFPGPFMVLFNGRWFGQYAPGTSLTLVPGIWLGVPWLIEPILGTFALLGIGLIAARLYDRRVATLAVLLGTLSPFYSYLAASYLSHTIALFYLVWGLWALLRFAQGEADWNLMLSAASFGMAGLTRDLIAILFVAIVLPGIVVLSWRRLRFDWPRWVMPGIAFIAIALIFVSISLSFNRVLTGSPWVTPRSLFFPGDRFGFGTGVGFYGQHTLAAGLVNLDELLTILAIDLFGWPFYLSLAFLAIPFLLRRANGADWLMLAGSVFMTGAFVGYFYHGIYLGPRYLFEILPFLLILTARGILILASSGLDSAYRIHKWLSAKANMAMVSPQSTISVVTVVLLICLLLCNLLYFTPRQIALHQDYTGLPLGYHIDVSSVYHPPQHDAIIVTDDYTIYQFVLFPLNDPLLHDDVIYAWASNESDYAELRRAFPGRSLYRLVIASDGSVQYTELTG